MTLHTRIQRAERLTADIKAALSLDYDTQVYRHARALAVVRSLWASRRVWQERIAEVEAERDAAISIARSNSHALDKARAELTRSWADREEELSAIAAKQFRDAKRIAELEAQVQR